MPAKYMSFLSLPSAPKEAGPGDPGPSSITFFAFSLIEGYISIVMDAETQKKYVTPDPRWAKTLSQAQGGRRWSVRLRGHQGRLPPAGSPVTSC